MKAGDSVKHKIKPKYGIGKIISLYVSQGTAMVKFENLEETTYHVLWTLEKHESRWFAIRRDLQAYSRPSYRLSNRAYTTGRGSSFSFVRSEKES